MSVYFKKKKAFLEEALENDLFEQEDFDINDFQDEVWELERELFDYSTFNREDKQLVSDLKRLVLKVKEEYNFYDEEAELDMMFPNKDDDDDLDF